jgi:aspartyl aminopeptidase
MTTATQPLPSAPGPLDRLISFLDSSPSPFHVVATARDRLEAAGFVAHDLSSDWATVASSGYVAVDGSLVAWRLPSKTDPDIAFRIVGAHTDSPGLHIKPRPDLQSVGWAQLAVEVYGSPLLNSWLDRDLGIAGRVFDDAGRPTLVNISQPVARIAQLAIHLDRNIGDTGLVLDRHAHLSPIWGLADSAPPFERWIAEHCGIGKAHWWDLVLYDVQPAAVLGVEGDFLASGRLDNQLSCWAAVDSLLASEPVEHIALVVLNDHEEVGSGSATGASGPLLERIIERITLVRGADRQQFLRALAGSHCVSADNAHAVHPNYPERHDPQHLPLVNNGPAIKINANQRYATSAASVQVFAAACSDAAVPHQVFVSRNNMPCGSTIGPLTATRLGIPTVDIGLPQLSMHSARELCGTRDPEFLRQALIAYLSA